MDKFVDTAETMGLMPIEEMMEKEQKLIDDGFCRCPDDMPVGPNTAEIEFAFVFTSAFYRTKSTIPTR